MSNQRGLQNSCKCSEVTALPVSSEYKRWRTPTQPPVTCQPSWHQEVQWICRTQTGSRQCLQTLPFPPARLHPCPLLPPPPPPHLPPASTFPSKTSSGQTSPSPAQALSHLTSPLPLSHPPHPPHHHIAHHLPPPECSEVPTEHYSPPGSSPHVTPTGLPRAELGTRA